MVFVLWEVMAVKRYPLKRLLYLLPVMLGVSVITFGLVNLAPGDPAEIILRTAGADPSREAVSALREDLGLNIYGTAGGCGARSVLTWETPFAPAGRWRGRFCAAFRPPLS
ncbi:MAG: hypothetical protein K6T65_15170 [Peptococcaceae bacterium]|nr:hypothetical protein [Peptococcaceae bacterium]